MAEVSLKIDGLRRTTKAAPDTPLLYVLTDELGLKGPRFGCGLAQCGSCSVLIDGVEVRSCVTPVSAVGAKAVTTLEGLTGKGGALHPVQQAILDEQAIQCGYCVNGMTIKAVELLSKVPRPTEAQIRAAMNGHLCRCGCYPQLIRAIQRAARVMAGEPA